MPSAVYEVRVLREVLTVLDGLGDDAFEHLARDIDSLAFAPRREDAEELGDGYWLLRSGRFVILYAIADARLVVVVVRVGPPTEILTEGH